MRLIVDISGHGLGHLTQISPVIRELGRRLPRLEIILRCNHAPEQILECLGKPFETVSAPPDIGLVMNGPDRVNVQQSHAAYLRLHADFDAVIEKQAQRLTDLNADFLLSDVAYTGLAGAHRAQIPSIALCSLHWGEMVASYMVGLAGVDKILADIYRAYNSSRLFILAAPRTDLPGLGNIKTVPPIVRNWGQSRKDDILARFDYDFSPYTQLGVISFGGISGGVPQVTIPQSDQWAWIVPDNLAQLANGLAPVMVRSQLDDMSFLDIISSADLVVTKSGYGTFAECVAYGTACLYVARPDWPEARELEGWIVKTRTGVSVTTDHLRSGDWLKKAADILCPPPTPLKLTGYNDAADLIISAFDLNI